MSKSLPPFYFAKRGAVMADVVDELQIEINANTTKANDAIERLVGKLDRLTTSLSRVNGTNLNGLANGVQRLGNAMQVMNTIKTADFTRLAKNLTRLGDVNVPALNSAASSMSHLTRAFNSLGTVSANAQAVGEMAKNIAKLGNKSVQTAITNIPQLAKSMNNLMATLSRAPRVSQNVIQMTNALANLASQGSKVGSASNSMVRGLNRTSSSAKTARKSFGGLASAIGKFYATYFMVIRGLKGLWSSIESTADYIEAYNYFNVALGKIGSDWSYQFEKYGYDNAESYAESFSTRLSERLGKLSGLQVSIGADGKGLLTEGGLKNLGLNIQEITQYASQLASVTNSVGQTGEVSLAVASSFTKLAGDISSLFNVDYSSVSKNLQSGLIGQSRALYKYGIDITNATLQTYAYNLGLSKSVSEMTQAEKMQLRMLAILDQSKVSWGDLANTINSPSNMIRQFTNNLKEAGMVLGQLFVPILQKVLPVINGVAIAIKRLLVSIAGFFGIKIDFDAFGQGYSDIEDSLGGVSDGFDDVASSAKKANAGLRAFDELKTINMPDTSGSGAGGVGGGGIDLTQQILDATAEYEKAWQEAFDKMESKAQEFANKFEKIFEPIKKLFKDISIGDWFAVGGDVSSIVSGIFNTLSDAIAKVNWRQIGINIGEFISGIDWTEILKSVGKFIWEAINGAMDLWSGSFATAPVETAILSGFAVMKFTGLGSIIIDKLKPIISDALLKSTNLGSVGTSITQNIAGIFTTDLAYVFNHASFKTIGSTIALGISSSLVSAWAGYNIGLSIREVNIGGKKVGEYVDGFVETWFNGCGIIEQGFANLMANISNIFVVGIPKWWNNNVAPWFTKEKWENLFNNSGKGLEESWISFTNWFNNIALVKWWNNLVGYFNPSKWKFPGIKTGLTSAWEGAIVAIKQIWNAFAMWLNDKLTWTIDPVIIGGKTLFSGTTINLGRIPTFATGGFPEDGLFMANHNELVGQFSNGKTAVANNEQITDGIKQGVREAVAEVLVPYLSDIAQSSRVTANKEFGITQNEVGKAARNYARDYTTRTGRPAYSF